MKDNIIIVVGSLVVIAGIGGAWFYFGRGMGPSPSIESEGSNMAVPTEQPQNQEAVRELPEIVARVNGQELHRNALERTEMQILAGSRIDPATLSAEGRQQLLVQALDTLVSNTLIQQEAASSGVAVEDAEVDAQLEKIKGQFEDSAKYQEALTQQGLSEPDFRLLITSDLKVQKYLEGKLNLAVIDVSEEELAALYQKETEAASTSTPALPPLDQVHDDFKTFVVQQKRQQVIAAYVKELSGAAQIEVLL